MPEERTEAEQEAIRVAMRLLGSAKTPKKQAHLQELAESRKGQPLSEEIRAKMTAGQAARREREKAEREAIHPPAPPRPRGRPKKQAAPIVVEGESNK